MISQLKINYCILFFLFLSCINFISGQSVLTPSVMDGADAAVFATIGGAWSNGYIPYKDLFDHKGPVLYLLNLLGFLVSGDFYGIVYIEIINLILFSTIFLFINRENSIIYFIFFLIIYHVFISKNLEGGNLTEEYALFFNGISACAWVKKSNWRFYLYGISGSLLFFLRVNLAALSLIIFIVDLCNSKNFFKNLLQTFFAFTIPSGLILFYFYYHDALYDFYQSYIIFNIQYTKSGGIKSIIQGYCFYFAKNYKFFFISGILLTLIYYKKRHYFIYSLIFLIFPFLFSCISGRTYAHYILAITPSIFILFSIIFDTKCTDMEILNLFSTYFYKHRLKILIPIYILIFISLSYTIVFTIDRFNTKNLENIREFFHKINLSSTSKILNVGNHHLTRIYYLSHALPPEKDFFPSIVATTELSRQLLKDAHAICPEKKYDFLLLAEDQELSTTCPYVFVRDFAGGKLYKISEHSSIDHKKRDEQ